MLIVELQYTAVYYGYVEEFFIWFSITVLHCTCNLMYIHYMVIITVIFHNYLLFWSLAAQQVVYTEKKTKTAALDNQYQSYFRTHICTLSHIYFINKFQRSFGTSYIYTLI